MIFSFFFKTRSIADPERCSFFSVKNFKSSFKSIKGRCQRNFECQTFSEISIVSIKGRRYLPFFVCFHAGIECIGRRPFSFLFVLSLPIGRTISSSLSSTSLFKSSSTMSIRRSCVSTRACFCSFYCTPPNIKSASYYFHLGLRINTFQGSLLECMSRFFAKKNTKPLEEFLHILDRLSFRFLDCCTTHLFLKHFFLFLKTLN